MRVPIPAGLGKVDAVPIKVPTPIMLEFVLRVVKLPATGGVCVIATEGNAKTAS
jgi:hypothetical protein